jgi:transposase InsO family protein
MMYPLVREMAATGARVRVAVAVACRVLKFSVQGYYKWLANPVSERAWSDAHVINAARDIAEDDPAFGYRFIFDELTDAGHQCSERRVWRLCSQEGLFSATVRRKRGKGRRPGPAVHDDLVMRDFTADAPNRLWLTDITEHRTGEGKLYLCAVRDVFAGRIVGYAASDRMKSSLAVAALKDALNRRAHPTGVIVHSDRGSQFRSRKYRKALRRAHLTGSMGRVGACADNAAMESFFSLLQKNVLNQHSWATREELRRAITHWIEGTYHRRRRQRRLGRLTPIEYETIMTSADTLAA